MAAPAYGQGADAVEESPAGWAHTFESASELAVVIERAPPERRPGIMRGHLDRLSKAPPDARSERVGEWIDLQAGRAEGGMELAEAWLAGLVEIPPEPMEEMIRSSLEALQVRPDDAAQTYRSQISRAMAPFYVPQWMRLKDTFNRIAGQLGQPANWG